MLKEKTCQAVETPKEHAGRTWGYRVQEVEVYPLSNCLLHLCSYNAITANGVYLTWLSKDYYGWQI